MPNPQRHFPTDFHRRTSQTLERIRHTAISGILNRHQTEIGLLAFDFLENSRDRGDGHQLGTLAEPLNRGQVAVGKLGT
jgi:hypothetical protein